MIVCVPVTPEGLVDPRWGRADCVAIASLGPAGIDRWEEHEVGWGRTHDEAGEGLHHAHVARFLREHAVAAVVAHHMGHGMQLMLGRMGIDVVLGASGSAAQAVRTLSAAPRPES